MLILMAITDGLKGCECKVVKMTIKCIKMHN